ncbi:unnamed protein product [Acanthosepion pharaonis]|uniref:LIM zinc-binding domain-containing protein n=1 Tax=Acanthosepion pharaonis TaxID=158019 RepID=A0A812CRY7_ACAPH|nr:unnamed protein product [Sepia pharaonis]
MGTYKNELFDSGQEEGVSLRSVKKYGCNQRPLTCPPQMHQSTSSTLSSSSFGHHSLPRRQMTTSPSDQCSLCGFSIQVDRVSIKGVVYHKACFKCTSAFGRLLGFFHLSPVLSDTFSLHFFFFYIFSLSFFRLHPVSFHITKCFLFYPSHLDMHAFICLFYLFVFLSFSVFFCFT